MDDILLKALSDFQNGFSGEKNTCELFSRVSEIMPMNADDYKIVSVEGSASKFKASIKVDLKSEDINVFINNYGVKNNETLRVSKTRKAQGGNQVLVKYFRCHHNTRYEGTKFPDQVLALEPNKRFKNTNCPYSMIVRIGKENDAEDFCSTIDIEWNHNHSVQSLHSLSFKDIPPLVTSRIKEMYTSGLLPGAAYRELLRQLRSECKDDLEYHQRLSDRSEAPRRKDFNDIYAEFKKERFGTGSLADMFSSLEERIKSLKEADEEYIIEYQPFDEEIDQPFILIVVTPLMKRVHKLVAQSNDLAFLDSSSNMEEYNLRVFIMVTHSVCGALPLGIVFTSDEKEQTLVDALQLFQSSLPEFAFYGASPSTGPKVIMTDNCSELREALKTVWPNATTVLCIFHVLQQVWRWLHERKNGIAMDYRPHLLLAFKRILYAECEDDLEEHYDNLVSDEVMIKYPNFAKYVADVYEDRTSWALCYRVNLPLRGNNTNNYCEAQFLVIKDEILNRQKEVNVVALLDKFTSEFDQHYRNKLLAVASGKFDGIYSRRFKGQGKKKSDGMGFQKPTSEEQQSAMAKITKVGANMYCVPSISKEDQTYLVDMDSGFCECRTGMNGSPCKHQYILWVNKVSTAVNFLPIFSKEQRQMYAEIAIGASLPLDLYEGLHDQMLTLPDSSEPCSSIQLSAREVSETGDAPQSTVQDRNKLQDLVTVAECKEALYKALESLERKLDNNESDQNFLRGVLKFADRAKKMPKSRLATCFHSFGAAGVCNTRLTATSIVKKAKKRGKIFVQPESVKRRKVADGTRRRQPQGQTVRNNPFTLVAGKPKRSHKFAENVRRNEPVAKKAGRSMATKTRIYEQ